MNDDAGPSRTLPPQVSSSSRNFEPGPSRQAGNTVDEWDQVRRQRGKHKRLKLLEELLYDLDIIAGVQLGLVYLMEYVVPHFYLDNSDVPPF
jgi:hypothetical protein